MVASALYGTSTWSSILRYQYARTLLNRAQRKALYASLNVCRTVSTDAMQVLMGSLPWDLLAVQHAVQYRIRKEIPLRIDDPITSEEAAQLAPRERKALIEERLHDIWQQRWATTDNGRTTFQWIAEVRFVKEHHYFNPSLQLCFLLTGHGSMNEFLFKRRLADQEVCDCNHPCEDWRHILLDCPLYADVRSLRSFGVTVAGGESDVGSAMMTQETYTAVGEYAKTVFERRRLRREAERLTTANV